MVACCNCGKKRRLSNLLNSAVCLYRDFTDGSKRRRLWSDGILHCRSGG